MRACELSKCRPRRKSGSVFREEEGGWEYVSWTFSDRRSNIRADVIQQGLQDTRKHARESEVVASKSEDAGREDNFQYKRYVDVLRTSVRDALTSHL